MNETKQPTPSRPRKRALLRYALSIHMKYGEVLHVEDLTKDEKDQYFELARQEDRSLIVEDATSVRHIRGKDIAKISVKAYDDQYEKWVHPIEKMAFSESTLGRKLFSTIIKAFVGVSFLGIIGVFALAMIEGDVLDVLFDPKLLSATMLKGFDFIKMLFNYTVILMILLNLIDLVLGLKANYFINQDGEEAAETSRLSNVFVTAAFIIVFTVINLVLSGLVKIF
jgi:hypothetical protein